MILWLGGGKRKRSCKITDATIKYYNMALRDSRLLGQFTAYHFVLSIINEDNEHNRGSIATHKVLDKLVMGSLLFA